MNGIGNGGGHEPKVLVKGNVNPSGNGMNGNVFDTRGIAPTLTTNKGEGIKVCHAFLTPDRLEKRQNGRRMKDAEEPMFTLTAQDLHGVLIKEATVKGYSEALPGDSVNIQFPNSSTRRGRVGKGVAHTLEANAINQGVVTESLAIRKLTPLECFRLQTYPVEWYVKLKLYKYPELIHQIDITRNDITKQVLELIEREGIKECTSDSQLYKVAGNGVTSAVSEDIGIRLMQSMRGE